MPVAIGDIVELVGPDRAFGMGLGQLFGEARRLAFALEDLKVKI